MAVAPVDERTGRRRVSATSLRPLAACCDLFATSLTTHGVATTARGLAATASPRPLAPEEPAGVQSPLMRGWWLALTLAIAIATTSFCSAKAMAQQSSPQQRPLQQKPWTMPRLAGGRPDLQGTWENNSATPLERPAQLAGKPLLSEDELAALKVRAAQIFNPNADAVFGDTLYLALLDDKVSRQLGATGTYSQNWVPDRYFERRTSLIEDPADGRLPPLTPQAVERRAARAAAQPPRPRGVSDMAITDRCITYGFPDLFAAYMSVYRIIQTPDNVVDSNGEDPRRARDPARWPAARVARDSAVPRRLARPLGRRHAGRRHHELPCFRQPDGRLLPVFGRAPQAHGAIHACERRHAALRVHGGRPHGLDTPVDGGDLLEEEPRANLRIRLPRRELQPARDALRRARRGSGRRRRAVISAAVRNAAATTQSRSRRECRIRATRRV